MNFKNKKVIIGIIIIVAIIGVAIANNNKQNKLLASELQRFTEVSKEFEKAKSREDRIIAYNKEVNFEVNSDLKSNKVEELKEEINGKTNKDLKSLTDAYDKKVSYATLTDVSKATNKELNVSIDNLMKVNKMAKDEALLNEEDLKSLIISNSKLIKSYNAQIYTNKIASLNKSIKSALTSSKSKDLKVEASDLKSKIEKDSNLSKDSKISLNESVDKTIKSASSKYTELRDKEDTAEAARLAEEQAAAQAAAEQTYITPENNTYNGYSNSDNSSYSSGSSSGSSSSNSSSSNSGSSSSSNSCALSGLCAGDSLTTCDEYGNCNNSTITQDNIDESNEWLGTF